MGLKICQRGGAAAAVGKIYHAMIRILAIAVFEDLHYLGLYCFVLLFLNLFRRDSFFTDKTLILRKLYLYIYQT